MMAILTSETCWAHKKWNKIASDIKLVFHSSTLVGIYNYNRCNYTELTPANYNISIPYTPIEYIIDNFEMLQL